MEVKVLKSQARGKTGKNLAFHVLSFHRGFLTFKRCSVQVVRGSTSDTIGQGFKSGCVIPKT